MRESWRRYLPGALFAAGLITSALVLSERGVIAALPIAGGVMAAVALAAGRRLLGWGALLWTLAELLWALLRLGAIGPLGQAADSLYLAGSLLWLVGLSRLRPRRWPRGRLLWAAPIFGVLIGLLAQQPPRYVPLLELALLAAALPALEATFSNEAPTGRLLWGLGLLVRALAAALFAWLVPQLPSARGYLLLQLLAYLFMAMGFWLEHHPRGQGLLSVAYGVIAIEVTIAVTLTMLISAQGLAQQSLVAIGLALGYLLFVGVMAQVAGDRQRRQQAEQQLKRHTALLECLVAFNPDPQLNARPQALLGEFLALLQSMFPEVQGIRYQAISAGRSEGYSYPLVTGGATIGQLLLAQVPDPGGLEAAMPLVAARLQGLMAHAAVHSLAQTDPLTGLLNRRGLEAKRAQLARARRLVAVMLDIDHFKQLNDRFGHAAGDLALQAVAGVLRRSIRADDLLVRWGGEEFLVLLENADLKTAQAIIQRVQRELAAEAIAQLPGPLTVSAGLASAPVDGDDSLTRLIHAADRALLKAKRAGRNRLEVGSPTQV